MQKNKTTNGFGSGLNLDYNPLQTPNTVMTNALNATLLTMNGNELTLQNDMGNGRVETAYLPEGYIPLGTAELGGIIYIVSYNPLTNKSLIGSFPSPERNITSEESNNEGEENPKKVSLNEAEDFYSDSENYIISTPYKRLDIPENELNPGDKYLIYCGNFNNSVVEINNVNYNYISAYGETADFNPRLLPRYVRFSIVSIASNGQVIDMTDSCVWLPLLGHTGYYFMCDLNPTTIDGNTDVDDYRSLVTSNYNVFSCKSSGKLGILAQLECINSFEITWDAIKEGDTWKFYFFTNWTYENDVEPDKINLYGLYIESEIDGKSNDDPKDIVISQYPYSVKSLLTRAVVKTDEQIESGPADPSINPYADPTPSTGIPSINFPMRQLGGVELVNTDIMIHQSIIEGTDEYNFQFHNPKYIDSLSYIYDKYIEEATDDESEEDPFAKYIGEYYESGEKSLRKNDGSDNQFLISTPIITNETKGILKLEISPTMPYGKLAWLKQTFNIDLSKLGTGEIDLVEYRYYILNNSITLSWGLDAYPERNKKINSVDFNFYEINSNYNEEAEKDEGIIGWIYDNQNFIDDYKVIDNEWTSGDDCTELPNVDADYSFTVTGKSSYSGHFEEPLNIYEEGEQDNVLVQNKVYLLQIDIDYSGKHIYYYRIFYTEPIFNNCYYLDEYIDYAKIDLDEKLTLSFNISNVTKETVKDYQGIVQNYITIYDSNGSEIEKIPSYVLDEERQFDVNYSIRNRNIENISFEVQGTTGYTSFTVDCVFPLDQDYIYVSDSAPEEYSIAPTYNTGISSRNTPNIVPECNPTFVNINGKKGGITISGNNVTLTGFDTTVTCPVVIDYDKWDSLNIQYELLNLLCLGYTITGAGGKLSVSITISGYFNPIINDSDIHKTGNEKYYQYNIDELGVIYQTIDNALGANDIVCIGGMMTDGSNDRHPWGIFWGYGEVEGIHIRTEDVNESGGHMYENYRGWRSRINKTSIDSGMILFYAARYNTNNIILFSYETPNTYDQSSITWPSGITTKILDYRDSSWVSPSPLGFRVNDVFSGQIMQDEVIQAPFSNIYKPVLNANTKEAWVWSVITYIHEYYQDYWIDITVEGTTITLVINNNCEIPGDIKVNNLHYSSSQTCVIRYEDSRRINDEYIIDETKNYSDLNLALCEDELINLTVSPSSIYLRDGNTFTTLKTLPDLYGKETSNNKIEIRCRNEMIEVLKISGSALLNAVWAFDDLFIALRNIYMLYSN